MAQVASCRLLTHPRLYHMGFVVAEAALGQVFSEYFDIYLYLLFHTNAPYLFIYRRSHKISVTRLTTPPSPPKEGQYVVNTG